jgi:two-component system cell cycle sensor histidine kinase/response regulator CckA
VATGEAAVGRGAEAPDPNRVLIHDFRNLLAVIVNYCELIAAETADPEAIKADIAEIRTAAERAIEMTDELRQLRLQPPDSEPAAGTT